MVAIKPTVSLDAFSKLDIRVGTIEVVESVKGSDKLVRLTVSFGDHRRKILAGMRGERENPKEIEGTQTLFLVNLEPMSINNLRTDIERRLEENDKLIISLKAADETEYVDFINVLDEIKLSGANKISLASPQ